jgi:hypothetical protein
MYDISSLEKIIESPEEVIDNIHAFWEKENAYRLMKSWHRYNNIPIDYENWEEKIKELAAIPKNERVDNLYYNLAKDIIKARGLFIQNAIPHIYSFLPDKDLFIDATGYFAAFTHSRGIGVGDRIVIDVFNSYYRGSLSMILNSMTHELYHVGFGHIQFAT